MFSQQGDGKGKKFGGSGAVERMYTTTCSLLDVGVVGGIWWVLLDPVWVPFLGREGEEVFAVFSEGALR